MITRAIGVDSMVEVDTNAPLELQPGDQVLLCSDGLTGPVEESQIQSILASEEDGNVACQRLLDAANANGGPDNITVVLLRAEGDGPVTSTAPLIGFSDDEATQELPSTSTAAARSAASSAAVAGTGPRRTTTGNIDSTQSFDPKALRSLTEGTVDDTPPELRGRRRRRFASGLLAGALLVAILAVGGWLLVNRAYYVGVNGDEVAVYRGLNQEIFGLQLSTVVATSDVAIEDLPARLVRQLEDGVSQGSLARRPSRTPTARCARRHPSNRDRGPGRRPRAGHRRTRPSPLPRRSTSPSLPWRPHARASADPQLDAAARCRSRAGAIATIPRRRAGRGGARSSVADPPRRHHLDRLRVLVGLSAAPGAAIGGGALRARWRRWRWPRTWSPAAWRPAPIRCCCRWRSCSTASAW